MNLDVGGEGEGKMPENVVDILNRSPLCRQCRDRCRCLLRGGAFAGRFMTARLTTAVGRWVGRPQGECHASHRCLSVAPPPYGWSTILPAGVDFLQLTHLLHPCHFDPYLTSFHNYSEPIILKQSSTPYSLHKYLCFKCLHLKLSVLELFNP